MTTGPYPPDGPAGAAEGDLAGLRVLLALHEPLRTAWARGLLEGQGCATLAARDRAEARAMAAGGVVDLLLADLRPPVEEACRLVRFVRGLRPWMPVLLLADAEAVPLERLHRSWEGPTRLLPRRSDGSALLAACGTLLGRGGTGTKGLR